MKNVFGNVVNVKQYPLLDSNFRNHCKQKLDEDSVLVLDNFLTSLAIDSIKAEGKDNQHLAYFAKKTECRAPRLSTLIGSLNRSKRVQFDRLF